MRENVYYGAIFLSMTFIVLFCFLIVNRFVSTGAKVVVIVIGVNDTPVFLLNEYIVELNPADFNILNQILNFENFLIEYFIELNFVPKFLIEFFIELNRA